MKKTNCTFVLSDRNDQQKPLLHNNWQNKLRIKLSERGTKSYHPNTTNMHRFLVKPQLTAFPIHENGTTPST